MFSLVLVRHGETQHNKDRVIQGQLDVPLSTVGLEQASKLGDYLQHQTFTKAYSSDLSRARETAIRILERSKGNGEEGIAVMEDARLRERAFGQIEGQSFKHFRDAASKANATVHTFNPPGGETVQQLRKRSVAFFLDLCQSILHRSSSNNNNGDAAMTPEVEGLPKSPAGGADDSEHPMKRPRRDSTASTCGEEGSSGGCDPYTLATVLVVSHRGVISELVRYFVDELGCSLPRCQINRTCPNAAFSRFTVSWTPTDTRPAVTCHQIYDRQHLYTCVPSSGPTKQEVKRNKNGDSTIVENGSSEAIVEDGSKVAPSVAESCNSSGVIKKAASSKKDKSRPSVIVDNRCTNGSVSHRKVEDRLENNSNKSNNNNNNGSWSSCTQMAAPVAKSRPL